ncbi:MAG: DUF58 domain-containing protein [Myxococcota bacterium]|nr:DUF58 domain-containing protein [Myxococcota bacterium]MEC9389170.1 DUF58 domain-containing protein [Myxococcota bacterium]
MSEVPWDVELLDRIERLHLSARRAVEGWRHGGHTSRTIATNIEFVDHKEYAPGDPIRHVDWKVAARTDKLVIRRHEAETIVPVMLVVDASGDLGTGQGPPDLERSKFGAAITMAATLAVFLSNRGDPVGLKIVAGTGHPGGRIPPGPRSLPAVIRALASVRPAGVANLHDALARLGEQLPRRSVAIMVSDLMEDPAKWGPSLGAMAARGVDCRVVHVYDPAEWGLDYAKPVVLFSPEDEASLAVDPETLRDAMNTVVDDYVAEVRGVLGRYRCSHHLAPIDRPLDLLLASVLGGRP